jgi:Zn-finger nucleic acid-binding protein
MNDRFKEKTMKCPGCPESTLVMSDRQGVEIDYCPGCRGVWLDRGELDKLIERSASAAPARSQATSNVRQPDFVDSDYQQDRNRNNGRRKSWLSDIFD